YALRIQPLGGASAQATAGTASPPPTTTTGRLAPPADPSLGGRFARHHTLSVRAGEQLRLALSSSDFDPQLFVRSPSGRTFHNDDVSPGDTNSALDLVADAAGEWTVTVTSYRPGQVGAYRLQTSTAVRSDSAA